MSKVKANPGYLRRLQLRSTILSHGELLADIDEAVHERLLEWYLSWQQDLSVSYADHSVTVALQLRLIWPLSNPEQSHLQKVVPLIPVLRDLPRLHPECRLVNQNKTFAVEMIDKAKLSSYCITKLTVPELRPIWRVCTYLSENWKVYYSECQGRL